ncbi:MAG TPA: hypothetical protein VKP61_15305 [Candidatus Acidoferrum sp.]|nr:hypothetical protein [Candidatus Acidoferrum sp.]
MSDWKKFAMTWTASTVVGFYIVFVLMELWNWFAVPLLRVPEANYWHIYGLYLMLGLLTSSADNPADERRWNILLIVLDACIPEHKAKDVREETRSEAEGIWSDIRLLLFSRVVGSSLTLGLGFVVHLLV